MHMGAAMQEFSVPAAYVVKPDDNITDDVFVNAKNWPEEVGLRRKVERCLDAGDLARVRRSRFAASPLASSPPVSSRVTGWR